MMIGLKLVIILFLWILIGSCSTENQIIEEDIYQEGTSEPVEGLEFSLEGKYLINSFLGLPD